MKDFKNIAYELRSYDGKINKRYWTYGRARRAASKLIDKDIMCGIWALVVNIKEDGMDDLDTLRWEQVIGC